MIASVVVRLCLYLLCSSVILIPTEYLSVIVIWVCDSIFDCDSFYDSTCDCCVYDSTFGFVIVSVVVSLFVILFVVASTIISLLCDYVSSSLQQLIFQSSQ